MSKETRIDQKQQSAWGMATLAIFLASAAYFLFTEHRAHLWIAVPLLGVCIAVIVLIWRTSDGGQRTEHLEGSKNGTLKKGDLR